jgi:hypothetical protein
MVDGWDSSGASSSKSASRWLAITAMFIELGCLTMWRINNPNATRTPACKAALRNQAPSGSGDEATRRHGHSHAAFEKPLLAGKESSKAGVSFDIAPVGKTVKLRALLAEENAIKMLLLIITCRFGEGHLPPSLRQS